MLSRIFHIHALTALHVGTGQGIGVIDLPIARERATALPMVPGSGIKGVLREELRPDGGDGDRDLWHALFGPEPGLREGETAHAGALAVGDAALLCLPARSTRGTFAWVTSPLVLRRYARDWARINKESEKEAQPPPVTDVEEGQALYPEGSALCDGEGRVLLEELDLDGEAGDGAGRWAEWIGERVFGDDAHWREVFRARFLIVSDEHLQFLAETATEVRARVRIDGDTRTVAKGALWYEENLPPETILWGLLACSRARRPGDARGAEELLRAFRERLLDGDERLLQLGGKATVGRGQVRWVLREG